MFECWIVTMGKCYLVQLMLYITMWVCCVNSIYQDKHQTNFYSNLLDQIYSSDAEKEALHRYSMYKNSLHTNSTHVHKNVWTNTETCTRPKNRLIFMKVHKAGSTTVMNIFLRYGDSHKLNIALPRTTRMECFNYLGYKSTIDIRRIMKIPKNETFHIFCNHAIYNKDAFEEIMGTNTVKIGIVREPIGQWISATLFYGFIEYLRELLGEYLSEQELLSAFLEDPEMYHDCPHTHNAMFEDLGLPPSDFEDRSAIDSYLRFLDEHVELVMLMEYFDESLILMKRILCWDIKDILYVPLNKNPEKKNVHVKLTKKDTRNLAQYNYADFILYLHFKEKFFRQIKESGNNFYAEVEYFKNVKDRVIEYCQESIQTNFTNSNEVTINQSMFSPKFFITSNDCQFMMSEEETLLIKLMKKARNKFKNYK